MNFHCCRPIANVYQDRDCARIASQTLLGELLVKKEENEKSYKVQVCGIEGWMKKEDVGSASFDSSSCNYTVIDMNVVVYEAADIYSRHLPMLYCGTKVRSIAIQGDWMHFETYGTKGWMSTFSVIKMEPPYAAKQFIGTRYLNGGNSFEGIDSVGLVYLFLKAHGINVPRNSTLIAQQGKELQPADLKAGDILFFFGEDNLGIYEGKNSYIACGSQVESRHLDINSLYKARRYLSA